MPSASRRDVFESQTTTAGAGPPSDRRWYSRLRQSSNSAEPSRPKRTVNWSSSPDCTPTNAFSPCWRALARSMRPASSSPAPCPASPAASRNSASEACKLAELDSPAPSGTSPATAAANPLAQRPPRLLQGPGHPADVPAPRARLARLEHVEAEPLVRVEAHRAHPRLAARLGAPRDRGCSGRWRPPGRARRCNRCGCPTAPPARGAWAIAVGSPPKASANAARAESCRGEDIRRQRVFVGWVSGSETHHAGR